MSSATGHVLGVFTVKNICFGSDWLSNATYIEYRTFVFSSVNTLTSLRTNRGNLIECRVILKTRLKGQVKCQS